MIEPLNSKDIAKHLQDSDIFISGVEHDACSNSILEAIACGVPVIAFNSGANKEIIKNNGMIFNDTISLLEYIQCMGKNLLEFQETIRDNVKIDNINKYIQMFKSYNRSY